MREHSGKIKVKNNVKANIFSSQSVQLRQIRTRELFAKTLFAMVDLKRHVLPSPPKLLRALGNRGAHRNEFSKCTKKAVGFLLHVRSHLLLEIELKDSSGSSNSSVTTVEQSNQKSSEEERRLQAYRELSLPVCNISLQSVLHS